MSYRDELGQAHERIAKLEEELREERAEIKARPANAAEPTPQQSFWTPIGQILGAGVVAALALAGIGFAINFVWGRVTPAPTMVVKRVDEVVRDQAQYRNVLMRVEGKLLPGTTSMRSTPCEVSMVLAHADVLLTVHMAHCSLPDAFRADVSVDIVAEGELRPDGIFEAKQIVVGVPKP
jgi:cytochrome c-type biogenesis protein CcmE